MGIPLDLIERMQQAGLSREDIQAIIDNWNKPVPAVDTRSSAAVRQARYRENKASQSVTRDVTVTQRKVSPDPSKEILSSPPNSPNGELPPPPLSEEKFPTKADAIEALEAWNLLAELKQLRKIRNVREPDRIKLMQARLRDLGSTDEMELALIKVRDSPFLSGSGDEGTWAPTIDWFLKPKNLRKILEGNYDEKPERKSNSQVFGSSARAY